jgi:uncharacterized protein YwgA
MDRQQIGVRITIDGLGLPFSIGSFDDRLILQKAIYLAQAAGVNLGYYYHWYLHGPYSPSLTKDEYAIAVDLGCGMDESKGWTLDEKSSSKLASLQNLIPKTDDKRQIRRKLELLASVHYLIKRKEVPRCDAKEVIKVFERFGKDFTEEEVKNAIEELKTHEFLSE